MLWHRTSPRLSGVATHWGMVASSGMVGIGDEHVAVIRVEQTFANAIPVGLQACGDEVGLDHVDVVFDGCDELFEGAWRPEVVIVSRHQSRLSRTVARTWSHHSPAMGMRSSGDQHRMAFVAKKPANVSTSWGWRS